MTQNDAVHTPEKRIEAVFQPQAWDTADNAIDIDGGVVVDVTSRVLSLSLDKVHRLKEQDFATDTVLHAHALEHDGPCRVEVELPVCDFFGVTRLSDITEEMLAAANQAVLQRLAHGRTAPDHNAEPGAMRSSGNAKWEVQEIYYPSTSPTHHLLNLVLCADKERCIEASRRYLIANGYLDEAGDPTPKAWALR